MIASNESQRRLHNRRCGPPLADARARLPLAQHVTSHHGGQGDSGQCVVYSQREGLSTRRTRKRQSPS